MIIAPRGLEGVVVSQTSISKVDGSNGVLIYRGYDATELARSLSFEQVVHLLCFGKLPNESELAELKSKLVSNRHVPDRVIDFLKSCPDKADPLTVLRTATSMIGLYGRDDNQAEVAGISLAAKFPVILSYYHRFRKNLNIVEPDPKLGHAENYLYMLTGGSPTKEHSDALNTYLILLADHGMNASTFAARVCISTLTDVYSAAVTAIGTLKGPLHGGAPSQVWEMLQEIGDKSRAREWLTERVEHGGRIMGFGHRVYRTQDPRSRTLKLVAKSISKPEVFELAAAVEQDAREMLQKKHPERLLDTNVEFYSSLVLNSVGIPVDMFTPTFACGRVAGWTAHILEQLSDNRLIRPESEYVGPLGLSLAK